MSSLSVFSTSARRSRHAVAATGAAVALAAAAAACTPPPAGPNPASMYQLRVCESGNNYAINTGNGYYGAYQFDAGTWHGLGFAGLPNQASPATQDAAMTKLWRQRGWSPWPACSARYGF